MAKMTQKNISKKLKISETLTSLILSGKRQVSWPLAARLAELFPDRTVQQWRQATPAELDSAFKQLPKPEQGAPVCN